MSKASGIGLARLQNESGFSFPEVMVASLIMLVVMGAMYAGVEQTEVFWDAYAGQMDMRQRARVALDQMVDEVRMAGYDIGNVPEVLSQADDFAIQFVGDIDDGDAAGICDAAIEATSNAGAERVSYYVQGGDLMQTIDCWDGSAWVLDDTPTTMLTDLDPNTPVFRFYDFTGTRVPLSGGALDQETRAAVLSVAITLDLEDLADRQFVGDDHPRLDLEANVRLHNLERPVTETGAG